MKIIHVGSFGTLGNHVYKALSKRHEVIRVSRKQGDIKTDISSLQSIVEMYDAAGAFDAVVCTAGHGFFGPFENMKDAEFREGVNSKLMGQVNLVLEGHNKINDGGSFTLTTGILSDDPVPMASNLSAINGAVNAFVMAAAIELKRDVRINVVSPGLVEESAESLGSYFPGHIPVSMHQMVSGYLKSVEGGITGQVIRIY